MRGLGLDLEGASPCDDTLSPHGANLARLAPMRSGGIPPPHVVFAIGAEAIYSSSGGAGSLLPPPSLRDGTERRSRYSVRQRFAAQVIHNLPNVLSQVSSVTNMNFMDFAGLVQNQDRWVGLQPILLKTVQRDDVLGFY